MEFYYQDFEGGHHMTKEQLEYQFPKMYQFETAKPACSFRKELTKLTVRDLTWMFEYPLYAKN